MLDAMPPFAMLTLRFAAFRHFSFSAAAFFR